jgi:hypothetical protein
MVSAVLAEKGGFGFCGHGLTQKVKIVNEKSGDRSQKTE